MSTVDERLRRRSVQERRDEDRRALEPKTCKSFDWPGVHVSLYAPWWAPNRQKRELGFMVRVRDPRAACDHHYAPLWASEADEQGEWPVWCSNCKGRLPVQRGKVLRSKQSARWRWLKVYVATTSPGYARAHGVALAEIESHLANDAGRLTTKVFARLKFGFGGPHV